MIKCKHCGLPVTGHCCIIDSEVVHAICAKPYELASRGFTHKCPKCNTRGEVNDPSGETIERKVKTDDPPCAYNGCRGCPMCGHKMIQIPVMVSCPLCEGVGYLKSKPKEILGVVGWALEEA